MQDVAEAIRSEVERALEVFRRFGESEVSESRGSGKWSRKEILGHLIDSAVNNHQRFVRAQFSSPFVWPGYDQEAWVELHGYRSRPWTELVALWAAANRHVAAVIESVPAARLATPCIIGDREATSLEWWMRDYLRHLRHHLAQLES